MVSRCVEHMRDANTLYSSGTVVGRTGAGNIDGRNSNMELEQYAAQLLSLHKHIAPVSSSISNGNQQQTLK